MSAKKPERLKVGSIAPFGLRMMPDLKQRIEDAARAANRSMNAEIVARLNASFEGASDEPNDDNTVFIVLDAKGHPLSWAEIYAHLYRLGKAVGWLPHSMTAAIINADMTSSRDRDPQFASLIRWYQRKTRELKERPPEGLSPRPPDRPLRARSP